MQVLTSVPPKEYIARERRAEYRSEYVDGHITAMAPGSLAHNFITGNVYLALRTGSSDHRCCAFLVTVRLKCGRSGKDYTYPDVMALCGAPVYEDDVQDTLTNPSLVVEVLSRSTQAYDRGRKFEGYKAVDTLREYMLVSQDTVRVEMHTRRGDLWIGTIETDLDATLELASVGCAIPMREIYKRTRFVPAEEAP